MRPLDPSTSPCSSLCLGRGCRGLTQKRLSRLLIALKISKINFVTFQNAFGCFDEDNVGLVHEDRLRELLTTIGDRFTDDDVDEMFREAPIKNGMFDYVEFTRILKHGAKEKDEA